jgi:hypothetical protein
MLKSFKPGQTIYHTKRGIFGKVLDVTPINSTETACLVETGFAPYVPRYFYNEYLIEVEPDTPQNRLVIQLKYAT